jgi:hypothetical protein
MTLRSILIVVLSLAGARDATSQGSTPVKGRPPAISVRLHAEHETAKVGEPIVLKAELTNRSDHEITFVYDANRGIFTVDVLDENGNFPQDKRLGYLNGRVDLERLARLWTPEQLAKSGLLTGNLVYVTVKSGGAFLEGEIFDVSKFYDMAKPGVYTIVVECKDPESGTLVRSSPVKVTVTR